MPLSLPDGHPGRAPGLPRPAPSCSTSATSARCGWRARTPSTALQAALTNDLTKVGTGPGAVHPPARPRRRARCSTTSSCGGSTTRRFDVMPNASNTDGVVRRRRRCRRRRRHRRPGPSSPSRARQARAAPGHRGCPRPPPSAASGSPASPWTGIACVVAGTGYTGEDGVECAVPADAAAALLGRPCPPPASCPPASAPATRCASRPACPLHGHELGAGHHPAARPASAGSWRGTRATSGAATPWRPSGTPASPAVLRGPASEGRRPPRAEQAGAARRRAGGRGHQRQLLTGARPRHRPRLRAARRCEVGDEVAIDVRGVALPAAVVDAALRAASTR